MVRFSPLLCSLYRLNISFASSDPKLVFFFFSLFLYHTCVFRKWHMFKQGEKGKVRNWKRTFTVKCMTLPAEAELSNITFVVSHSRWFSCFSNIELNYFELKYIDVCIICLPPVYINKYLCFCDSDMLVKFTSLRVWNSQEWLTCVLICIGLQKLETRSVSSSFLEKDHIRPKRWRQCNVD